MEAKRKGVSRQSYDRVYRSRRDEGWVDSRRWLEVIEGVVVIWTTETSGAEEKGEKEAEGL